MVPETRVFQAADSENSVILACNVLTDPPVWRTDRQTELRWLRRAETVAAFTRKNRYA